MRRPAPAPVPRRPSAPGGWWGAAGALVWKDVRSEWRTRESLAPMLLFGFAVISVFGFGLGAAGGDLRPVLPGLLWATVYFVGLLGLGRSFSAEATQDTLAGLRLAPADSYYIFAGKLVANLIFLLAVELVTTPLLFAMLEVPFTAPLGPLVLIMVLGTIGFAAVGTLLSALAAHTRAGEMLLPVLVFPVLVPAVIGAVGATASVLGVAAPDLWPRWLGLLVAYDVLFLSLPLLVFGELVEP